MSNPNPKNGFGKNPQNINRNGRPTKEWTWRSLIVEALENKTPDGEPLKKAVANALVDKAIEGDVQAIKEVGNRIDGLPEQNLNANFKGDLSVVINKDGFQFSKETD